MQFTNKSRKLRTALRLILALGLIPIFNGCLMFHNRTIDETNLPAWWGELQKGEVLQLKQDALLEGMSLMLGAWIPTETPGINHGISVEQYKADPAKFSQYAEIHLVVSGTRLRCVKLERFYTFETNEYRVYAEILDGDFKGRIVSIPAIGDANIKGRLRLNANFLEPVQ
jgi:hypothetical protein